MKKLAAIVSVSSALVCAATVPGYAREGHDGNARVEHRASEEHHGFRGHEGHAWFGWRTAYPYGGYEAQPYAYAPPPPSYLCPTYGAYYPNVATCPVPWVVVTP